MVMAAAVWLGQETHSGLKWPDIYEGTRREYLRYAREMLTVAGVIGLEAPAPAPMDADRMWKHLVEAASS